MNPTRFNIRIKNIFLGILATMMIFSFTSSVTKVSFAVSSVVPAAKGFVRIKKSDLSTYAIKIKVSDLTAVTQLDPPRRTYVVWMVTDQYITRNLGQLNKSILTFSQKLKTSFEVESPLKPSKIFITAEDDASILRPGTQVVLATNRF